MQYPTKLSLARVLGQIPAGRPVRMEREMQRSNRNSDSTTSPGRDPLWPGTGTETKIIPSRNLSEALSAQQSQRGPATPGKAQQLRDHASQKRCAASSPGASPCRGHTPNERGAPGRPRPTCPRQAPARGPSFVRRSPRCRSPRAPFPPPGRAALSAGAGPTPELTCGDCGVGSAAGLGSLGSARGPLTQPPRTPHRRPEPARPERLVRPDGRWAPGARARP